MAGMASTKRAKRPIDMALSLAVLLIPVLVISWFFARHTETPIRPVEWRPVLAQARAESPYRVLAPVNLPASWVATKVLWAKPGQPGVDREPSPGSVWQLGMLSPDHTYVTITQRDAAGEKLVAYVTRDAHVDGQSSDGWVRYVSADQRTRGLVRTDGSVTSVVAGDTTYSELEAFASTLRNE